ncbi:hypothetical protein ACFC26_07825 [Kitasatospora purpeofusca]
MNSLLIYIVSGLWAAGCVALVVLLGAVAVKLVVRFVDRRATGEGEG